MCGDDGLVEALGWEVLELGQSASNTHAQAIGHNMIAWHAYLEGNSGLAATHSAAAVELAPPNTQVELDAASTRAEVLRASGLLAEALRITLDGCGRDSFATAPPEAQMPLIVMLALIAADTGLMDEAARMIGAMPESYHNRHNLGRLLQHQLMMVSEVESRVRLSLGADRYNELTEEGASLTPSQAAALALSWTSG